MGIPGPQGNANARSILGWVNVKVYGAVGDGVHDDTAAILAAYNATPEGGVLYFPPATGYVMSKQLSITKYINLKGYWGRDKASSTSYGTRLIVSSATVQQELPSLLQVAASYVEIDGFSIEGAGASNGSIGLQMAGSGTNGCHGAVVRRCVITGWGSGTTLDDGSDHVTYYDTQATDNTYGVTFGASNQNDFAFIDCLLDGNTTASAYLVANNGVDNVLFLRTHLGFSDYGILQDSSTTSSVGFNDLTLIGSPIESVSVQHMSLVYCGNVRAEGAYWTWNGTPSNAAVSIGYVTLGPVLIDVFLNGTSTPNASSPSIVDVLHYSNFNIYVNGALNGFASAWFSGSVDPQNQWLNGAPFAGSQSVGADNVSVTSASTDTNIVGLAPAANATNFTAKAYLNVTTTCTVTLKFTWNNGSGLQTYYWYNAAALAVGSYPLAPILVNAYTFNGMTVVANASVASAITVSATITPEL